MNPILHLCHCGKPLHYTNPMIYQIMKELIAITGETIDVTVNGVTYIVPRHYIALHGIKASEIGSLGFPTKLKP